MNSAEPVSPLSAATVGDALAQLTSGWTPGAGVSAEALAAARQALAHTLIQGKSIPQIHAVAKPVNAAPPAGPGLAVQFEAIAATALAAPQPTMAVVRSALAATVSNPAGLPDWAQSARVAQTYGPFQDAQGVLHWVDLLIFTASLPFAFAGAGSPFGVFPIREFLVPPLAPTHLTLGSGSVWFVANLLASGLPAGDFTGFAVTGGSLHSSSPLEFQSGTYVVPAGATLTLEATLAPLPATANHGGPGGDALAATFTPPPSVTIQFTETSAVFDAVADASAHGYGSTVQLHWNKKTPTQPLGLPLVLIPCDPNVAGFTFQTVVSQNFVPSGSGGIVTAGWALTLAATTATTLPETAGPGMGLIEFGTGASVQNAVEAKAVPISFGLIEIGTGFLFVMVEGKAAIAHTTYQLWPLAAPSKLNATLEFDTRPTFIFSFLAKPGRELLTATGDGTTFFDRPLTAAGARFPFVGSALLQLDYIASLTFLFLFAARADAPKPIIPLALRNALLGVDAPEILVVAGLLEGSTLKCVIGLYFNLRWLLPTLPDPYAANFDLTLVREESDQTSVGMLLAGIVWTGGSAPNLSFLLLPPVQGTSVAGTPFPSSTVLGGDLRSVATVGSTANPALLDVSTRVDLWGVVLAPAVGALVGREVDSKPLSTINGPAPALALTGMELSLNQALVATFALPQVSWEPMENTGAGEPSQLLCEPAADGLPLLLASPNSQQLVPFIPAPVLIRNIENVAAGTGFAAFFSLPFGLNAVIIQGNRRIGSRHSSFGNEGGQFRTNIPQFPETFVPNPTPPPTEKLLGALQLTVTPVHPEQPDAMFPGFTDPDSLHGPFLGSAPNGYGYTVLGLADGVNPGVGEIFENDFGSTGERKNPGVPLRRIDFSGYGASIYSDWNKPDQIFPAIIKVQFETSIGRTAYEVVKAASVIYPYCVRAVRTITMLRGNAGWVNRSDSGWQPASQGQFQFPPDPTTDWTNRVHQGALEGAFNPRNIREQAVFITVKNTIPGADPFIFEQVWFDAEMGVSPSLKVSAGGFTAPVPGITNPPVMVASKDIIGYLQLQPDGQTPSPEVIQDLIRQVGPFNPAIGCTVEVGPSATTPGTTLRCSAFTVDIVTEPTTATVPALGVALRGAPQIPRGGGWSMGRRKFSDPAPSALPNDFPVPLVQPNGTTDLWFMNDASDVLQVTQPDNFYNLMHSTGTNKVLFESPQIPTTALVPGLQFPKPNPVGPPKPGAVPTNQGSPNLGDIASILNSTGLFPDIADAISMIEGALEQINTIAQGFKYSKTYNFDPNKQVTLIDLGIINIVLQYADTTDPALPAATLNYSVDSTASPSWSLSVGTISFLVNVDPFGLVLTITGGFKADENTKAGLTNLNVQMGGVLSVVKSVFSDLQALAQFLPGGAGANLDIALSNGKLTVSDTFTIGDMPLGLGNLTDISLDLGLSVQFSPISVDFQIGIGSPGNPFNWIVDPLAGNGLMTFGVVANQPSFTIQAGIGLGLAIDLGIASGSASITIAVQLNITGNSLTLMAILTGQASVDVLDGLASASITLSAALGVSLSPAVPPVHLLPLPASIGPEDITLIASCSVGIHITICWVVSINFDGSWTFSQSFTAPKISVG